MILLSEYHASSIRLRRVVLLRSGIRLSPSDIRRSLRERCELLWRIEYHCEAKPNNITARRAISLFAKQRISLIKMQKRESFTELYFRITLSSVFIASFAFVKQIHRAMPIPLLKFSDKDYTHFSCFSFFRKGLYRLLCINGNLPIRYRSCKCRIAHEIPISTAATPNQMPLFQ